MPPVRGKRIRATQASEANKRLNTIGIGVNRLSAILDNLDQKGSRIDHRNRLHVRWAFRHVSLKMRIEQPMASTTFPVACRNLSISGMGLLHSAFVNINTRCSIELPQLDGSIHREPARVVRCSHLTGRVHELGIQFDEHINIKEYVKVDLLSGQTTYEHVDPKTLEGSICIVASNALDITILQKFMSDTRMQVWGYEDASTAAILKDRIPTLMMVENNNGPLREDIVSLHNKFECPPLIVFGKGIGSSARTLLRCQSVSGVLSKPLDKKATLSMIADCLTLALLSKQEDEGIDLNVSISELSLEAIGSYAQKLEDACKAGDAILCFTLCQQIRNLSIPAGFDALAKDADIATTHVTASMNTEASKKELDAVLCTCRELLAVHNAA